MTKWCIPFSLGSEEEFCGLAPPSPSALVCNVNDDYSGHGDIYLAFATQLTMLNKMTQMRLKGLDAKAGKSFGAEHSQTDCYSDHSQDLSGGQG